MVTIGTAGHIDHGKSSLVKALTSIDPDRLPEEKRRGMTIDLGFAWLSLSSGEMVGIVDVPGHKDFIRNVIPGLGGIDAVLLVIAADDGWMPQTEEHVHIIDLLDIKHGIVVLNKVDLIDDPSWLELVEKDIREKIGQTGLRNAPVIRVSTKDGTGMPELKEAIEKMVLSLTARHDIGKARLPVDRAFIIKGSGVVVTGTLLNGSVSAGDEVVISPGNLAAHLRSIESYKQKVGKAEPGSRVALNLAGIKKEDVKRGDVVFVKGEEVKTTSVIDAQIRLIPQTGSHLKTNTELVVYIGTKEVLGRIKLFGEKVAKPGEPVFAQLRLSEDITAYIGDHFILRRQSPAQTIGGGIVLDPYAGKHSFKEMGKATPFLRRRAGLELDELILSELGKNKCVEKRELLAASAYASAEIAKCVELLRAENKLITTSSYVIDSAYWQEEMEKFLAILHNEHSLHPLEKGISQAVLQGYLSLPREAFNQLVATLVQSQKIVREEDIIALSTHQPRLSPEEEMSVSNILKLFERNPPSPPTKKELLAQMPDSGEVIRFMCRQNMLVELPDGVLLERKHYESVRSGIIKFLKEKGAVSIQDVHSLFGFSRKYTLPLLNNLDSEGITARAGDRRVLAKRP